jgi:leucyl aminopeptidase
MTTTLETPEVRVSAIGVPAAESDLLIVPAFEEEGIGGLGPFDEAAGGELARAFEVREFRAQPYKFFLTSITDGRWRTRRIALAGAGRRDVFSLDMARKTAAAAAIFARERRIARVAFLIGRHLDPVEEGQAVVEGLVLGNFDGGVHKTDDDRPGRLLEVLLLLPESASRLVEQVGEAARRGAVLAESCNVARGLAVEPGNVLPPRVLAERAAGIASNAGLQVEILERTRMEELGMGLLLGVARGSDEPPRLIVLRHEPPGAAEGPVLGLVGKGVTFDTGGISIKPADGMERMKDDMAGAAAVVCAMRAMAVLGAPIRVVGVVPAAENMPGGRAIRPGDVLRSAAGKTVEVLTTDAEGRMIMADALWYARRLGATHLVDIATLTGSCIVALGRSTSGLFGAPREWVETVKRTADRAGDRSWEMPMFDDYREQLRSDIADLTNSGGRQAGAITAAWFLKEFTGGLPWVHMDIAGTAWADEPRPYLPKGPSGVGVRTLAALPFTSESWQRGRAEEDR